MAPRFQTCPFCLLCETESGPLFLCSWHSVMLYQQRAVERYRRRKGFYFLILCVLWEGSSRVWFFSSVLRLWGMAVKSTPSSSFPWHTREHIPSKLGQLACSELQLCPLQPNQDLRPGVGTFSWVFYLHPRDSDSSLQLVFLYFIVPCLTSYWQISCYASPWLQLIIKIFLCKFLCDFHFLIELKVLSRKIVKDSEIDKKDYLVCCAPFWVSLCLSFSLKLFTVWQIIEK